MLLLIINPNTNTLTNRNIAIVASSTAKNNTKIEVKSANSGLDVICSPEEVKLASKAVLTLIREVGHKYDAVIVAAFSDPGVTEA